MKLPPTLADVAERAGVSTATVSRCLNEPERVVAETRRRVLRVIDELGYTPHFGGRALASNRTNTVGAVIPTMDNAIFARGLQAFEEELAAAGVTLLVGSSSYDPGREAEQVRALIGRGADGMLLIGRARPDATYRMLETRGVPFVLAWTWEPSEDRVYAGFDNRGAAMRLAGQVLDRRHRRIAMIAGVTAGNDRASDRLAGVRQALASAGLDPDAMPVLESPYALSEGGRAFAALMQCSPRPTVVVCGNDVIAVGALLKARAMGLRVPGDVSITGFDNIELASVVSPTVTTVHVPHRRMGRAAARLLLAMREGRVRPESQLFETEFVEGGSLGPAPLS